MNILRGVPLKNMSVKDLRMTVAAMKHDGGNVSAWPKQKCVKWLEANGVLEINVGRFCRMLLRIVVEKNGDGFPVGLNYKKMEKIAKKHFPNSAVTEHHFSWYATSMRAEGEVIPVYRK